MCPPKRKDVWAKTSKKQTCGFVYKITSQTTNYINGFNAKSNVNLFAESLHKKGIITTRRYSDLKDSESKKHGLQKVGKLQIGMLLGKAIQEENEMMGKNIILR